MEILSVLIPAYNEESTIRAVLDKLLDLSQKKDALCGLQMEVVVVNDGSTDGTEAAVLSFVSENRGFPLKYVRQSNGGKGTAIRTALERATGDVIVIQDADCEYDPSDFEGMLPYIINGEYQVVYGSRFLNHKNKISYRSFYLGGRLVSFTANVLYNLNLTDEPTCYKMFTREVADNITLKCTGFEFCPEFTAKVSKAGYPIMEVPVHYWPRSIEEGKKINWKDGVQALWTLLKYRIVK